MKGTTKLGIHMKSNGKIVRSNGMLCCVFARVLFIYKRSQPYMQTYLYVPNRGYSRCRCRRCCLF